MNSNAGISPSGTSQPAASGANETHHERQTLLLMLLAQVCSLHDATPRTFVVHVLALFERGILDEDSIRFLFDLGLVPKVADGEDQVDVKVSSRVDEEVNNSQSSEEQSTPQHDPPEPKIDVLSNYFSNSNPLAIVPYCPRSTHPWSRYLPHSNSSQQSSQESLSRQKEATAIRRHLERHESFSETGYEGSAHQAKSTFKDDQSSDRFEYNNSQLANLPTPWSVEHHPLTLSRYQRDFHQVSLLASGAFGSVYHSIHKLENKHYAVKCVTFSNSGYLSHMLGLVVREVRCLAMLDHVNCVRYYTSWLEPSWMTGDQNLNNSNYDDDYVNSTNDRPKLLTDIERVVNGINKSDEIDDTMEKLEALMYENDGFDWAKDSKKQSTDGFDWVSNSKSPSFTSDNRNNKGDWRSMPSQPNNGSMYSLSSAGEIEDSDVSEWTREMDGGESHGSQWDSKYSAVDGKASSMHGFSRHHSLELVKADQNPPHTGAQPQKPKSKLNHTSTPSSQYKYKICLFIQMQLCRSTTLNDWIKQRNNACVHFDSEEKQKRARPAFIIFRQIVNGLEHVHSKNIIHRDLKPANIFAGDNGNWCIGDFGLSKLMRDAHNVPLSPNSDNFFSSRNFTNDGHTAGVGTASYAAPEQITDNNYGPEVDIFALGIILLELFSNFTSEHERAKAFYNLRHHRELEPWMHRTYPEVAALVLACTQLDHLKRPTATDILNAGVFQDKNCTEIYRAEVSALKVEIGQRDNLIDRQKDLLQEKDREIEELRQRLSRVEAGNVKATADAPVEEMGGSSSSSDDDY